MPVQFIAKYWPVRLVMYQPQPRGSQQQKRQGTSVSAKFSCQLSIQPYPQHVAKIFLIS